MSEEKKEKGYEVIGGPCDGIFYEQEESGDMWFMANPDKTWPEDAQQEMHFYRLARDKKSKEKYWNYIGTSAAKAINMKKPNLKLKPFDT